jgi:hypothetical protein
VKLDRIYPDHTPVKVEGLPGLQGVAKTVSHDLLPTRAESLRGYYAAR